MADISDDIDDWSATAASNNPSGSTTIGTGLDDNLRAIQAATKAWKDIVDPYSHRNLLVNGAFSVAQRGASFTSATTPANSDDTYLLDRWTLLSDGNDIVDVTQNTGTVPTGGLYSCALDVETANKKFGIIQFIEQKNCHHAFGSTVSLSFKARKGGSNATVGTMRAAIISWDSTADTVTSDVVSAWGVSGTNPTLVANWTYENTPADLTLTTSFQTFSIEGISADTASAKNLAVFLYYNNADGTVADFIYITDVQLERASKASEFERRKFSDELSLCQRYAWVWNSDGDADAATGFAGSATDSNTAVLVRSFPFRMRVAPTLSVSDVAHFDVSTSAATGTASSISISNPGTESTAIAVDVGTTPFTAANAVYMVATSASARLTFSSEL